MKKIVVFIFVLMLILSLGILTGCAKEEAPVVNQSSAKIASTATDAEGVYNGRIDEGSVEIAMSPEDIVAFRSADVTDQLADISEGDQVRFSYAPNADGQLVLSKIEKIK